MTHAIDITDRTLLVHPEYYPLETLKITTNARQLGVNRALEWQKFSASMQVDEAASEAGGAQQRYHDQQVVVKEDEERAMISPKHKEAMEVC